MRQAHSEETPLSWDELCIAMREQHREEVAAIRRPWTFGAVPHEAIKFRFDEEQAC